MTSYGQLICASHSTPDASLTRSYWDESCKNEKYDDRIETRKKNQWTCSLEWHQKLWKLTAGTENAQRSKTIKNWMFQFNGNDWLNEFIPSVEVEAWISMLKDPRMSYVQCPLRALHFLIIFICLFASAASTNKCLQSTLARVHLWYEVPLVYEMKAQWRCVELAAER